MNITDATMIVTGIDQVDNDTMIEAWQKLIDTAIIWKLEGYYGRTAARLIEEGLCTAPEWVDQ